MNIVRLSVVLLCFWILPAWPAPDQMRIRSFLEVLDAGDLPVLAGQELNAPELVAGIYRDRNHAPLWLGDAPLAGEVANLLTAIKQSLAHGLSAGRYHLATLETLEHASDEASRLSLELLLTDAFLSQALHRARGAVSPASLDPDWQLPSAEVDVSALLQEAARLRLPVIPVLEALWPADAEYARLLLRRAAILASGEETMVVIVPGALIKPGQASDRVLLLKQRLMGPGDYSPLYDDVLLREVTAFQRASGLEADGIVGNNTLEFLNATRVSWIDRIDANLERWRWLPRDTPKTYIRVNIAAFTLRAIEQGRSALAMKVIVGKPYRRTPVFTESLKYLVLNPYWNVPYSIASKDKLPLLQTDAAAESRKGFEVKLKGSDNFVAVDALDWSVVTPRTFDMRLRQRPGEQNALGRIKFMMPNPYSIYLHDTPSRELFAREERSFSSGCIRLEQPVRLAQWLLSLEQYDDAQQLEGMLAAGITSTIYLKKPVPTYIVYFTAFSLDDGEVIFRRDIYGRDQPLIQALKEQRS